MQGAPGRLAARIGARVAAALTAALVFAVVLVASGVALVLLVGTALDDVLDATAQQSVSSTLTFYVLVAVPVLIVVAGLVFYLFAGQPLAAVEALRARAAAAADDDPARPVPEPAAQDEVARLAETMTVLLGRLEEGRGAQRRLASAGHEMHAPLAALGNGIDQIQRGQADRSVLGPLRGEVDRLAMMVDALSGTGPAAPPHHDDGVPPDQLTAPVSTTASGPLPAVHPRANPTPDQDPGEATTVITAVPRGPRVLRPVRDEDAKEDPITAPRGIPVVRPGDGTGPRRYPQQGPGQQGPPQNPPGNLTQPNHQQQPAPQAPPPPNTNPRGIGQTDRRGGPMPTDPRGTPTRGQSR